MPRGEQDKALRWGVEWYTKNSLDGERRDLQWRTPCVPAVFLTRREAREWIKAEWGFLRGRKDLRAEPHGWRMPQAVRVEVIVRRAKRGR